MPDNGELHRYEGCSISSINRGTVRVLEARELGAKFRMPSSAGSRRFSAKDTEPGGCGHVAFHVGCKSPDRPGYPQSVVLGPARSNFQPRTRLLMGSFRELLPQKYIIVDVIVFDTVSWQ